MDDLSEIRRIQVLSWGEEAAATEEMYKARIETAPYGCFVSETVPDGRIIAVHASYSVNYDPDKPFKTWFEASGDGVFKGHHAPDGNAMYGVDLGIDPDYSGSGAAAALVLASVNNAAARGKRYAFLGCRIPDYHRYADIMSAEEYVRTRVTAAGDWKTDATRDDVTPERRANWNFLDSEQDWFTRRYVCGRTFGVRGVLPGYMEDPPSRNYAVHLVWEHPALDLV